MSTNMHSMLIVNSKLSVISGFGNWVNGCLSVVRLQVDPFYHDFPCMFSVIMSFQSVFFDIQRRDSEFNTLQYWDCTSLSKSFFLCNSPEPLQLTLIFQKCFCSYNSQLFNLRADKYKTNKPLFFIYKNSAFIYVILWKNNYIPFLKNTGDNEIKKWGFDNVCHTSFEQLSLLRRTVQ